MNITYIGFIVGTLTSGLIINHVFKLKVFSEWQRLLAACALVALPFIAWDVYATYYGHWSFNPDYILDLKIGNLPFEEVLFFFVIPFVMLSIWLLVQKQLKDRQLGFDQKYFRLTSVVLFLVALTFFDSSYTFIVFFAGSIFVLVLSLFEVAYTKNFWLFQVILYALFFASNTVLTAIPIVEYADQAITTVRIGTIPIEDFVYNFIVVNGFILIATNRLKLKH